jgi:two-component system, OmpR family, sensor kinase
MATLTPPRWSVRFRILGVILLITALGMTVAGASAYLLQRERVLDVIDEELFTAIESARAIATGLPRDAVESDGDDAPASPDPVSPPTSVDDAMVRIMQGIIPGRSESSVALIDGDPVYIPPVEADFQMFDDDAFMDRVWSEARGGVVSIGTALTEDGAIRYIAAPVTIADDDAVGVYVTGYQIQGELDDIDSAFTTYAIIAGFTLLAIGAVGWFVAGRLLRPIRDVTAAASRITGTDLSERIPVTGRDDVSRLTETINGMFERLEESATAQRQLLDDVRHELTTPITIVRGHLELLDPESPNDVEATRALAIDELDRMTELVSDIDVLAQASMAAMLTEPTDVADLTQQVFAKARAIAGHEWQLDAVADAVAPLAPSRITQAWLQLADNAAKYSPQGTVIRIGSNLSEDAVEMWVADEGPGIPEEAQKRIFERFGRADPGRGVAGSGLGLPIVAAIARGHGGYVSLHSAATGSRFGIVVPLPVTSSAPPPAAGSLGARDEHPPVTSSGGER